MAAGVTQKLIPLKIAAGTALSNGAAIGDHVLVGIQMPAAWTAAAMTFQVSDDAGVTWVNLSDDTGAEVKLAANPTAGARIAILNLSPFVSVTFIKIRSGTGAAPVNQAADAVVGLVTRKLYAND